MKILLSDNVVVDDVNHCYPASINGMLVIEVNASTMDKAVEAFSRFQNADLSEITLQVEGRPSEVFRGYHSIAGMSYNFNESKVTLFLEK